MKIKAFGMDIQVTEESVFVNGKEVYNKIDQAEQRMNVIGQNGNDGLHYGVWKDASEITTYENTGHLHKFWEEMNNDLMDNNRNEGVWDTDN